MENRQRLKTDLMSFFSLFSSFSTLFCCALPSLLASLGLAAAVTGVYSNFGPLKIITRYHHGVFGLAAILLALNGWLLFAKSRGGVCSVSSAEGQGETGCAVARSWNFRMFWVSFALFMTGIAFTYVFPKFY